MEKSDVKIEMEQKVSEYLQKIQKYARLMLKYSAIIASAVSVAAYLFLYAFFSAYVDHFSIPADCIEINLKTYIHVSVFIISIISYTALYWYEFSIAKLANYYKITLLRIVILFSLFFTVAQALSYRAWYILFLSITLAVLFELVLCNIVSWKRNHRRNSRTYNNLENSTQNEEVLRYSYARKYAWRISYAISRFALAFFILFAIAYSAGMIYAQIQNSYSVMLKDNVCYITILANSDHVVSLEGNVDEAGNLKIRTGTYHILSKIDKSINLIKFNSVTLVNENIDYSIYTAPTIQPSMTNTIDPRTTNIPSNSQNITLNTPLPSPQPTP